MKITPVSEHKMPSDSSDEIDLMALLGTLWRGKLWLLLSALIAMLIGGLYAFKLATPLYPARAVVALENEQPQIMGDIESVLAGGGSDTSAVNTEVEVLRSRNLIEKLVRDMSLIEDPEFNGTLVEKSSYHPITILKNILGATDKEVSETEVRDAVIDVVLEKISVSNIRQSLVFSIGATTTDPQKSADIANRLAALYIHDQLEVKFAATEQASIWLSEKAAELKLELELAEAKFNDFNANTNLISPEALAGLSRQIKELRIRLKDLQISQSDSAARVTSLKTMSQTGDMAAIAAIAEDTRLNALLSQSQAEGSARAEFDRRFAQVLQRAELEAQRAQQQTEALMASEAALSAQLASQSNDLVQLQQFQREAEANRLLYESFLTRLKETAVQKGLQQPDSRLLSSAVPRPASSPRKSLILALSLILGGFIGSALVLLNEMRHNAFRTSDDLEAYTGYLVMGMIPKAPKNGGRKSLLDYVRDKPTSIVAESIRNLRTSLLLSAVDQPPQIIMSTSSVPGEGKTTLSLTLAQNMAGLGKKVLVIEGDIRRRVFSEYFGVTDKPGFLAVISGDVTLQDTLYPHPDMRTDILFGENSSINAADLYSSERFVQFLKSLRKKYDFIIIDTPPVLAVPDARVIGPHVDAILYTVLWNSTTKTQVKQGLSMFESVGLRVDGLVLGQIDSKKMKGYGYAGQYGYDAAGSGYYDQEDTA